MTYGKVLSFKRAQPGAEGQPPGIRSSGPSNWRDKYVGGRPVLPVVLDGIPMRALLDTGSQVTTIPYVLFKQYWNDSDITRYPDDDLSIIASNGQPVPQVGFKEVTIKVGKVELAAQGLIIVDIDRHESHPRITLGTNVIENCLAEVILILQQVAKNGSSSQQRVLQKEIRALMKRQQVKLSGGEIGSVRMCDSFPIAMPPKSEMMIWCRAAIGLRGRDYQAMVEPVYSDSRPTILTSRGVVDVRHGRVPVRIVNIGEREVHLPRYATLAKLFTINQNSVKAVKPLPPSQPEEGNGSKKQTADWCQQLHLGTDSTPSHQKQGVYRVVQEYERVFSKHPLDFRRVKGVEHQIPTGDHPPIKERYRPVPPAHYQHAKGMLRDMKEAGVIRDSCSPWAAPLVLVKKKDNTMRMCVDYRKVNCITHKDAYPLPRIEESLAALKSTNFFSTLDLTSWYWQVPVAEADKEKTAFTTPMGLSEFNCMPFGLCNAPGTFQRLMECCLGHRNFETVLLYLDDVIVYSTTYKDHLKHLAEVFDALASYGLKVKPSKCHLLKPKVQYLGHVVSADGVAPDPDKITMIKDWPRPSSIKEVRQFLGLVGYYRRFIPGFTKMAAPMQDLLIGQSRKAKNQKPPFRW
ncbi:uncharacterized protein [Phyllobates terribilis]|uniref:uncharacterized protein n=1 Tax=Phyllobates terribilis TaxID=111132 RepID=UPI003CCA7307